jgi:TRAP transporter TAXI family solute receptor
VRLVAAFLALLTLAAPAAAQEAPAEPEAAAEPELVWMGTGSVAGVYYPVGVALCRLVNQHRRETGLRCAARPSEGSVGNITALRDGSYDLAIVQSDTQAAALAGAGAFAPAGPFEALRSVASLYPEPLTVVARADAGIRGLGDLAGKRVAWGAPGSGTRALADRLLAAQGWTPASFAAVPDLAPDRLADALCEGEIDAFAYVVGHPALVVQEATTACAAVLVEVAGPTVDALVEAEPAFVAATIPAGLYRGAPRAVATFGVGATLVTRAHEPDERIDTVVRSVFGDLEMLRGLDPALVGLDPEAMARDGLSAPLHPAAERYYRERGWLE